MLVGTVSGAAEVLGRSQPAVSRLLDKLEYELGVSLFERRRGRIAPTTVAHLLLDEIERAYVSLETLNSFATRLASGQGGLVSFAVMPALGIKFMPSVLADFSKRQPHTRIRFSVRMSPKIEEWAASQQIDFGLAETPFRRSGFQTEVFSDAPYLAAVPADHPLADRSHLGPVDLKDVPLISWTSFVPARHLLDQVLQSSSVRIEAAFETSFSASAVAMVKHGMGVAIIDPYTAMEERCEQVRLVPFLPRVPFNVAILRPEMRAASPVVDELLSMMMQKRDALLVDLPR